MTPSDRRVKVKDTLDVCKCGDYRRDHKNGSGACGMANDLTHGFKPCKEFRLAQLRAAVSGMGKDGDDNPL